MAALPEFQRPPIVEVALAVSIRPLEGLRTVALGRLWTDRFARAFPKVEEHPPVVPAGLAPTAAQPGTISLELSNEPPTPRLWFLNEAGTELVQVQNNWFARNWRSGDHDAAYPRYPALRKPFRRDFASFATYVRKEGLGTAEPIACEVSYFNHIELAPGQGTADVFSLLSNAKALPSPEFLQFAARFPIVKSGNQVGSVQITAEPAIRRTDGRSVVSMTLTARGAPLGDGHPGVMRFLDVAHDSVVRLFAAVTRDSMHVIWGRSR